MTRLFERPKHTDLKSAKAACVSGLIGVFLFSALMNVLLLTGPFYMLQIYDRVLTSQSIPTLVALSILIAVLLGLYGLFDFVRTRLMTRIGNTLDLHLAEDTFAASLQSGLAGKPGDPARDLRTVRQFVGGPAAAGLFDIPWMPAYIAVIFVLHPLLGLLAVTGAMILILIALTNGLLAQKPEQEAARSAVQEDRFVGASRQNAETIQAMGMLGDMQRTFGGLHKEALVAGQKGTDTNAAFSAPSRSLRLILQSAILGVGAYLVIAAELSPGAMIAASIIFARALAPVDMAIAQWRSVVAARQSWQRLKEALSETTATDKGVSLPLPSQSLVVSDLYVALPGQQSVLASNISLLANAGEGIGIIGASGSGKSSFLRGLVGAWPIVHGEIRIDGATLDQWSLADRGRFIGYLPQEVYLFEGSVAQNIARFQMNATSEDILEAATTAGAHDLILQLPDGYDTQIGSNGVTLSAGQRQRVALARALYGQPFLVVLDEPNAHIDSAGERALLTAIDRLKARGAIVLVVAHRKAAIARLDKLLVMHEGKPQLFGPRDEVLAEITARMTEDEGGLRVVRN